MHRLEIFCRTKRVRMVSQRRNKIRQVTRIFIVVAAEGAATIGYRNTIECDGNTVHFFKTSKAKKGQIHWFNLLHCITVKVIH